MTTTKCSRMPSLDSPHVAMKNPKRLQGWSRNLIGRKVWPTPPKRWAPGDSKKGASGSGQRREQFADAVTTMLVVPLRVGFFFDPFNSLQTRRVRTAALTVFTILDVLSKLIQFTLLIFRRISKTMASTSSRQGSNDGKTAISDMTTFRMMSRMPSKIIPDGYSMKPGGMVDEADDDLQDRGGSALRHSRSPPVAKTRPTKRSQWPSLVHLSLRALVLGPWELLLCAVGEYNLSHIVGVFRLAMAGYSLPGFFSEGVLKEFQSCKFAFSTVALVFHGAWIGLCLCHLSAVGYMFIDHYECGIDFTACPKSPLPGCWVLKDDLERGKLWRQYVRTMYWV